MKIMTDKKTEYDEFMKLMSGYFTSKKVADGLSPTKEDAEKQETSLAQLSAIGRYNALNYVRSSGQSIEDDASTERLNSAVSLVAGIREQEAKIHFTKNLEGLLKNTSKDRLEDLFGSDPIKAKKPSEVYKMAYEMELNHTQLVNNLTGYLKDTLDSESTKKLKAYASGVAAKKFYETYKAKGFDENVLSFLAAQYRHVVLGGMDKKNVAALISEDLAQNRELVDKELKGKGYSLAQYGKDKIKYHVKEGDAMKAAKLLYKINQED